MFCPLPGPDLRAGVSEREVDWFPVSGRKLAGSPSDQQAPSGSPESPGFEIHPRVPGRPFPTLVNFMLSLPLGQAARTRKKKASSSLTAQRAT